MAKPSSATKAKKVSPEATIEVEENPVAATLSGDRSFDTQYVGTLPTAKGYGEFPLFALRRRA
jgi:hypothetical protein